MENIQLVAQIGIILLFLVIVAMGYVIIPEQRAYVVERLGRYDRTLGAGFHVVIPFVERVAYRHTLKEIALDVEEQVCITRDNVQLGVDGILFMKIFDPELASYGIGDVCFSISQVAQTTLRSEIGKIELDSSFKEREAINANVVQALDAVSGPWGVKVLRYEIQNIRPPPVILSAMEQQMRAEREKRALVLKSEAERDAEINESEGMKQGVIKQSEGYRQRQINEAEGEAAALAIVTDETARGLAKIAAALSKEGGDAAMQLKIAEKYVDRFGELAKEANTLVVPADLADIASMVALAAGVVRPRGRAPQNGSAPLPSEQLQSR